MKIYIAGKITGERDYKKKFRKVEKQIAKKGHSPMNPALLNGYNEFSYEDYIKITRSMQETCEAVYFLHGWEGSNGANKEYYYALKHGQKMFFDLNDIEKK